MIFNKLKYLVIIVICLLLAGSLFGAPNTVFVNTSKSLSKILNMVEKEAGTKARNVTSRLQIYIEDVYLSQGSSVKLKANKLVAAIKKMIAQDMTRRQMKKEILKMYKAGDF